MDLEMVQCENPYSYCQQPDSWPRTSYLKPVPEHPMQILAQGILSEVRPRAPSPKPGPGQLIRSLAQSIPIWTRKTTHSHLRAYSQMHLYQQLRGGQGTWTCWWEFPSWNMNQTATSRLTTLDCHLCQRLYLHEAEAVSWPFYWEQASWLCPSWAWLPRVLLCSVR